MLQFISNIILGLVLVLSPGPAIIEVMNRGLKEGFDKSLLSVLGIMISELIWFSLIIFGLTKIASPKIQMILGIFGACFLVYLGISYLLESVKNKELKITKLKKNPILTGFLSNFLSPVNAVMWIGIIAAAINLDKSIFALSGLLWGILGSYVLVALASLLGKRIFNEKIIKIISAISGVILIIFAIIMFLRIL